jgi:prepilin-type N-terminal cleavage/methylation domain-containing protein
MKKNNKSGFTLIELLAVIVIIMILVGLLMPVLYGTKKQAKQKQAKAECIAISSAINGYHMDNRAWPSPEHNADKTYGDSGQPNAVVIKYLKDATPPYISIGDFKLDSSDNILDPWGDQYVIKLDTDYDGYWQNNTNSSMPNGVEVSSETFPASKIN